MFGFVIWLVWVLTCVLWTWIWVGYLIVCGFSRLLLGLVSCGFLALLGWLFSFVYFVWYRLFLWFTSFGYCGFGVGGWLVRLNLVVCGVYLFCFSDLIWCNYCGLLVLLLVLVCDLWCAMSFLTVRLLCCLFIVLVTGLFVAWFRLVPWCLVYYLLNLLVWCLIVFWVGCWMLVYLCCEFAYWLLWWLLSVVGLIVLLVFLVLYIEVFVSFICDLIWALSLFVYVYLDCFVFVCFTDVFASWFYTSAVVILVNRLL